jgi:hypothetical protein
MIINLEPSSKSPHIQFIFAIAFSVRGGVATLIGCELLSDVHKICSLPGDGEDLSLLRRHFLQGRGWRSLAALQCLGVQVTFLHHFLIIMHLEREWFLFFMLTFK